MEREEPINDELASYFLRCITDILDGEKAANAAFNLSKSRGRPCARNDTTLYESIYHFVTAFRDSGGTYESAIKAAENEFRASESKIKRYYKWWKDYLQYKDKRKDQTYIEFADWYDVINEFEVIKPSN